MIISSFAPRIVIKMNFLAHLCSSIMHKKIDSGKVVSNV